QRIFQVHISHHVDIAFTDAKQLSPQISNQLLQEHHIVHAVDMNLQVDRAVACGDQSDVQLLIGMAVAAADERVHGGETGDIDVVFAVAQCGGFENRLCCATAQDNLVKVHIGMRQKLCCL